MQTKQSIIKIKLERLVIRFRINLIDIKNSFDNLFDQKETLLQSFFITNNLERRNENKMEYSNNENEYVDLSKQQEPKQESFDIMKACVLPMDLMQTPGL